MCCCRKGVKETQTTQLISKTPSIENVTKNPVLYFDSLVTISGTLINAGKDYFKDLRLVLKDSAGSTLKVLPWLPVEVPPVQNPSIPRPKILSDYLNKKVTLKGYLRQDKTSQVNILIYYFEVKEVEIIQTK